jgi:hypothetical protein
VRGLVGAVSAVAAGVLVYIASPAGAATTLGAAAADRGRYFRTVYTNGNNTTPTASCAVG